MSWVWKEDGKGDYFGEPNRNSRKVREHKQQQTDLEIDREAWSLTQRGIAWLWSDELPAAYIEKYLRKNAGYYQLLIPEEWRKKRWPVALRGSRPMIILNHSRYYNRGGAREFTAKLIDRWIRMRRLTVLAREWPENLKTSVAALAQRYSGHRLSTLDYFVSTYIDGQPVDDNEIKPKQRDALRELMKISQQVSDHTHAEVAL